MFLLRNQKSFFVPQCNQKQYQQKGNYELILRIKCMTGQIAVVLQNYLRQKTGYENVIFWPEEHILKDMRSSVWMRQLCCRQGCHDEESPFFYRKILSKLPEGAVSWQHWFRVLLLKLLLFLKKVLQYSNEMNFFRLNMKKCFPFILLHNNPITVYAKRQKGEMCEYLQCALQVNTCF